MYRNVNVTEEQKAAEFISVKVRAMRQSSRYMV